MASLILIRHSVPRIRSGQPAHLWPLTAEGRARCRDLARRLVSYRPERLFSSREIKAEETARLLGEELGLAVQIRDGLHEQARRTVSLMSSDDFQGKVKALFARPQELVFGEETAAAAGQRFAAAIDALVSEHPDKNLLVVAHGTVMSLFAAARSGVEAYPLWSRLGLPSFVALSLPTFQLLEILETVDS